MKYGGIIPYSDTFKQYSQFVPLKYSVNICLCKNINLFKTDAVMYRPQHSNHKSIYHQMFINTEGQPLRDVYKRQVLVAVVIVIVFGVISFTKMTPDLFPNINTPYVIVDVYKRQV